MPAAVAALAGLGVTVTGRPFVGIRYLAPGRAAPRRRSARGPASGVRRTDPARRAAPPRPSRARRRAGCAAASGGRAGRRRGDGRGAPGPLAGRRRRPALAGPPRRSGCEVARPRGGRPLRPAPALPGRAVDATTSRSTGREHAEAYVTPVGAGPGRRRRAERRAGAVRRAPGRASRPCWPGCAAPSRSTPCSGRRSAAPAGPPPRGRAGAAGRRRRRLRRRADRRGARGRAGHGRGGGGRGRRRAPAGLPGGLAAGDPALPVVGDRAARL